MDYTSEYSDEQLATLLRTGSEDAFTTIFNRYRKRLFVEAYYQLEDTEEAKDVVQEIFISLWQNRTTFSIRTSLPGYLLHAVRNKCIDKMRTGNRTRKKQQHYTYVKEASTPLTTPIEIAQLNQQLKDAINTISPQSCNAFKLMYLEQKTHKEIAQEMGIKVQSVSNLVSHALKILRKKLQKTL